MTTPVVLNAGSGRSAHLPGVFAGWRELRLDIDPAAEPDILASLTDMGALGDGTVDAVWCSHVLEHLAAHEVAPALAECRRVLRGDGVGVFCVPDLRQAATLVLEDRLEDVLYESPAGPVAALDVIFGHRASIARGRGHMGHRTGFTAATLGRAITSAGFAAADIWQGRLELRALAYPTEAAAARHEGLARRL